LKATEGELLALVVARQAVQACDAKRIVKGH